MGSSPSVPTPPEPPKLSDSISDYVENYPSVFNLQKEYAPQEAQLQLDLLNQYASPIGLAMQRAQQELYPQTSALQEQLAAQAAEGIDSDMPEWMSEMYTDQFKSALGSQAGSGIGADYVSRGLLAQQQAYKQYNQNLGLSLTGRQPLAQAGTPQYTNQLQQFSPTSAMNYAQQGYGTRASLQQYYGGDSSGFNVGGGLSGALGGAATGAMLGGIVPGIGTAVGAIGGGLIGGLGGGLM